MTDQMKGVLLTALGVLAVVPDSLAVRLFEADIITFIFIRAILAGSVIFAALALIHRAQLPIVYRGLGWHGVGYAATMMLATMFFLSAIQFTAVANALFIVSTSPVFAALASRLFLGEPLTRRMAITTVFALIGIAIIASGSNEGGVASTTGDLLALGAAIALAVAFTFARAARRISMVPATSLGFLMAAIVLSPFAAPATLSTQDWWVIGILAIAFIPIGTSVMSLGPRYITAAEVSLLLLLEAVLAPLLVWWVVGEAAGPAVLIGGAVVIGTLLVSNLIALGKTRN